MHDGVRTEIRRRFIEGEGHLVEEVPVGNPISQNQAVVPQPPAGPPQPVVITVADIPLSLATQVIEANGMVCVPVSFLNEDQLAELKIDLANVAKGVQEVEPDKPKKKEKLTEAQAIKLVQAAQSFDELNDLTRDDHRSKVLAAAEIRAAELKG